MHARKRKIPVLNAYDRFEALPPPYLGRKLLVPLLVTILVIAALAMVLATGMIFGDFLSRLYNFLGH